MNTIPLLFNTRGRLDLTIILAARDTGRALNTITQMRFGSSDHSTLFSDLSCFEHSL